MAANITTTPTFAVGASRVVFEGRFRRTLNGNTPYDVSSDGQHFLRVQQVQPDHAVTHIDIVLNWFPAALQAASGK